MEFKELSVHYESTGRCLLVCLLSHDCVLIQTLDDEPSPVVKQHVWQNRPLLEWTNQQVSRWLMGMNMDQYIAEFTAKGVDGRQLMEMDSSKLKVT